MNIYDIAKAAKVSPATVSRVINGKDRVKAETRQRILEVARRHGFQPQVMRHIPTIGIASDPYFSDRIAGYSATITSYLSFALTRAGMNIVLPESPLDELPDAFLNGMIVVTHSPEIERVIRPIEKHVPTVHLDLFADTRQRHAIVSDHEQAGYLAAEYFLRHGRRRLAFLSSNEVPYQIRLKGYLRAMKARRHTPDKRLLLLSKPQDSLFDGLKRIVRAGADAVYVPGASFQGMEALHLLQYVLQVPVPAQIAVIGGENEHVSAFTTPPMTAISEPLRKMAEESVQMLKGLMANPSAKPLKKTLPVKLIQRASGG